ncbi:MAG: hypothetical protein ACI3VQ_07530 [Faecousia sp.]
MREVMLRIVKRLLIVGGTLHFTLCQAQYFTAAQTLFHFPAEPGYFTKSEIISKALVSASAFFNDSLTGKGNVNNSLHFFRRIDLGGGIGYNRIVQKRTVR